MADEQMNTTEIPAGIQKLFDERRMKRVSSSFHAVRSSVIRNAILAGAAVLIVLYMILPVSRVRNISVHTGGRLSRDYIMKTADISTDSIFYLNIPVLVEHRLKSDPLIEDADVSLHSGNIIEVAVTEKKVIGYRYENEPVVLLQDGTTAPLKSEYLDIIASVPLITGFSDEEQTRLLIKAFKDIEPDMIEEMAEVSQYDMGYDSQSIRVLMRTGGYFLAGYNSLHYINSYNEVYSQMTDTNQCIIVEDGFRAAYTKTCPWNEPVRDVEYWLDGEGNKIINSTGLPAEKHYYGLSDGAMAHDAAGNRIVIPINARGDDEPDPYFEAHYYAGYYETGQLVIPEDAEAIPEDEEVPAEEEVPEEPVGMIQKENII